MSTDYRTTALTDKVKLSVRVRSQYPCETQYDVYTFRARRVFWKMRTLWLVLTTSRGLFREGWTLLMSEMLENRTLQRDCEKYLDIYSMAVNVAEQQAHHTLYTTPTPFLNDLTQVNTAVGQVGPHYHPEVSSVNGL